MDNFNLPFENMWDAEFHLVNEEMIAMLFYWKRDLQKYRVEFEADTDPHTGEPIMIELTRTETREVILDMLGSGRWFWVRGQERFMS